MKLLTLILSLAFIAAMAFSDTPKKDDVAKGKSTDKITDAQQKTVKEKPASVKDSQTKGGKKGTDKTTPPVAK